MNIIYSFFGFIDWVVYNIISAMFRVIVDLSTAEIFYDENDIISKIYVVVGVFILFKLVISAIQFMVNPDLFDDKEKGLTGILKNTVISIAFIVISPAIFNFATVMEKPVIETIPRIILGNDKYSNAESRDNETKDIGESVSMEVLKAFVSPKDANNTAAMDDIKNLDSFRENISKGCGLFNAKSCVYDYMLIISTICGGFIVYILLSMVLDVAVRTVKLSIIRMLAPIPISTYVYNKDRFNKFVKVAVQVYVDLFVRMAIVYFVIFAVKAILASDIWRSAASDNWIRDAIVHVALVVGLLMFAKSAPKFLSDLLGIQDIGSSDMKDMFKPLWQRAGGQFATPIANSIANYRQARDMGRNKGEALRRAVGGAARGVVDSVQGFMAGDDWAKMKSRHEAATKRSARRIARIANYERDQQQADNKVKRFERALKAMGFDRNKMDEYRNKANQEFDTEMSSIDSQMNSLAHQINTTTDPTTLQTLRSQYKALADKKQNMLADRKKWVDKRAYIVAAREARDNTLANLDNVISNSNNRIAQLDAEIAAGGLSDTRRAQIEMEKLKLENNVKMANDEKIKISSDSYVNDSAKNIEKNIDSINEVERTKISKHATTYNAFDTYFGGKGSRGKVYLDFADTLAKNRSSIYTGEAMTKMRQNADILVGVDGSPVRHDTSFSNGQGTHPTFTYSEISDLLTRAKSGLIDENKLKTEWGFDNVAMVQSAFEELEKKFAKDYVNANIAAISGDVSSRVEVRLKDPTKPNSTITEWWDRFEDTIMGAGLPLEEARHYREEFLKDPGAFMASASDLKEKLTTRGTRYVDAEQPKDGK